MRHYLPLFVSALIIFAFWAAIYIFATNILALYLAIIFALITLSTGGYMLFRGVLVLKNQSRQMFYKLDKGKLVQKELYDSISKTA